jgi:signal transduction histidine kinase/HPt (histidine-containing phosphotransfer) domain-containing protein
LTLPFAGEMPAFPEISSAGPLKILIIEDDPGDFGLAEMQLRVAGSVLGGKPPTILWLKTLAEGLVTAERAMPDVVLLDLSLPDSSGLATVRAACAAIIDAPIVVFTGHDEKTLGVAALESGAQDYLVKGQFDQDALACSLRYALVRHKLKQNSRYEQQHLVAVVEQRTAELAQAQGATQSALLATQVKSDFLAHMSHEIRTPINAIVGAAHLLELECLVPRQHVYANIVLRSSHTLSMLINDILDLSKVEAGGVTLCTGALSLPGIMEGLAGIAAVLAEGKNIAFDFDLAPEVPPLLIGDAYRLEQVLSNLLSNAIKFTTRGEIALQVRKLDCDAGNIRLRFALSDTGIGIPADRLDAIFDPFVQADVSTTHTHGGTGLGLTICHQLVALMGGSIKVESTPGQGSCFEFSAIFKLPPTALDAAPPACSAVQRVKCNKPPLSTSPLAGRRVLIVDDHGFNRVVLQGMLQHFGIEVDAAVNGHDAVDKFHIGNSYDAILMDLQMPGFDGFECAQAIRALPEGGQVPIIAITADVLPTTMAKCLAAGMNDHLGKPVSPEVLESSLMRWIFGKEASGLLKMSQSVNGDLADHLPNDLPGVDLPNPGWSNGSARTLARMLDGALAECADDPAKILRFIASGELVAAARITHDLMAVAATVGAGELAGAARQLNREIRAGSPCSGLAQEAVAAIGSEFAQLMLAQKILSSWVTPCPTDCTGEPK